jgi:hypothetical protein
MFKKISIIFIFVGIFKAVSGQETALNFCGETLPMDNDLVNTRFSIQIKQCSLNGFASEKMFARAQKFFPYFETVLAKYQIPEDFKYLAIVESSLTNEVSSAGATGYWQLMRCVIDEVGGMEVSKTKDERFDPYKSTETVCKYFVWLHKRLKNWTLVAAAYNGGIGRIMGAIERQKMNNYYFLRLPNETLDYVYRIVATKYLFEHKGIVKTDNSAMLRYYESRTREIGNEIENLKLKYAGTGWKKKLQNDIANEEKQADSLESSSKLRIKVGQDVAELARETAKTGNFLSGKSFKASFINGEYVGNQSSLLIRLDEDILIPNLTIKRNQVLTARFEFSDSTTNRLQVFLSGSSVEKSLSLFSINVYDTDGLEGINLLGLTDKRGNIYLPASYNIKLKFSNLLNSKQ